jgi:DNA-binding transcriptional LysR family regulator
LQQSICIDAGFLPTIAHESVHGHTVLKMVEHQFGVTLLPLSFMQFSNEKVRFIPLLNIPQRSEISILWKKSNKNPCLAKVLDLL